MTARLVRQLLTLLALVLAAAGPAHAQGISSVRMSHISVLPSGAARPLLITVDGKPVAIAGSGAWALTDGVWRSLDHRGFGDLSRLRAGASGGGRAIVLTGGSAERIDGAASVERVGDQLRLRPLAQLSRPLAQAVATVSADTLMIAGIGAGGSAVILRLSLDGSSGWRAQPGWPGGGPPAALATQAGATILTTLDRRQFRWTNAKGWEARTMAPLRVVAGSARPIAQANLLYLLADGGRAQLYSYSTITDAWAPLGYHATASAAVLPFGDGMLSLVPGAGGWRGVIAELQYQRRPLGWLDWTIVIAYLAAMLAIGFHFWRRSRMGSTSEFFLGSRTIPFWAAGVSMFAGNTSSISYLAVPAKAFDTDWQYMMSKIVTVAGLIAVAFWVIPLFRRLNLVSVFSYLETRFHPAIRMLSSALAIAMHVGGRMGVVLLLPALAIGTITGTSVTLCILVIGVCTIIYTALGGMKAVIWTDVFQVLVLMGGALFAIGFMIHAVGATQIIDTAARFDKTKLLNTSLDFTTPTVWGFIILITFDTVLTFPKDQVLMQRALSTPSAKAASRSVWTFAAILLPGGFIFYIIGTTLFAYYRANPGRLDPLLPVDAVFPAFIGTELPHGVTGIIIAGLFAAAMGTLSGTINSVATLLSVDFYAKLRRQRPTQQEEVRFAEWMTVLVGAIGVVLAIILSRLEVRSLLDLTIELFGLLGGSCAGAYTLGMFTTRANWQGTAIGIVAASLLTLTAWIFGLVHPYFYLAIAIVASIVIGYLASLFFPAPEEAQLRGLTVFTGEAKP